MNTSTVVLDSDTRRMMVVGIAWRELQQPAECLNKMKWPMLNEDDWDRLVDAACSYTRMISQWGTIMAEARDPELNNVELPLDGDELRLRVGEYIKGIYENELNEAELEDMQGLLDHTSDAKAFLDSLGGPIAREQVPA